MKIFKGLAVLGLVINVAYAAENAEFKKVKKHMILGKFEGKLDYSKKPCTVDIRFKKNSEGEGTLVTSISFLNYKGKPTTSTIVLNGVKDNVEYELEEEADAFKAVTLSKSALIAGTDGEEDEVTGIEIVRQYVDYGKLQEVRMEWFEVNQHSDPHEDQLACNLL